VFSFMLPDDPLTAGIFHIFGTLGFTRSDKQQHTC
jgi:hypothetical protein